MRACSDKQKKYDKLKEELLSKVPDSAVDISPYKELFKKQQSIKVISKRKMETVNTLSKFLSELENHLLIYPDKQGIKQFFKVVEFIKKTNSLITDEYFARVESLTAELKPSDTGAVVTNVVTSGTRATCMLMPRELKDLLISEMTDSSAGQDWVHLMQALGKNLPETIFDKVRVRMGDIDDLERSHPGKVTLVVRRCLDLFERNCQQNFVNIDVTNHVIELLKNKRILHPPYTRLANKMANIYKNNEMTPF